MLKERYITTPKVFVHLMTANEVPEDFPTDLENAHPAVLRQVHDWGDYAIAPGVTASSHADCILIYERKPIWPGERGCFFIDGRVQWLPEAEFQERMKKQWPKGSPGGSRGSDSTGS